MKQPSTTAAGGAGFSLVELLAVIAIMTVLFSLAMLAFNSVAASTRLQSAGDALADLLIFARQRALTRSTTTEVRLTQGADGKWRTGLIYEIKGTNETRLGRQVRFPDGVCVLTNQDLSPLAELSPTNASLRSIRYQPNGEPLLSAQLAASPRQAFLTLGFDRDATAATAPANYVSIAVNPYTGQVKAYRP